MSGPVIPVTVPPGGGPITLTLLVTVAQAPPVLTSIVLTPSGPVAIVDGQSATVAVAGSDQYGQPKAVTVVVSGTTICSASVVGQDVHLTGLKPGSTQIGLVVS